MRTKDLTVSIIIPAFNEQENIPPLIKQVLKVLKTSLRRHESFEIIIVDDGSTDQTFSVIRTLTKKDKNIFYLSLSRNFGHQSALKAGLDCSRGNCVISLDADLQHPPALISTLLSEWRKGVEIVYTVRTQAEGTSFRKSLLSDLFYKSFRMLGGVQLEIGAADFRLLDRKVVAVIKQLPESVLFLRGMISWIGFKKKAIPYKANARMRGQSHYTYRKMLLLAISGITSYSIRPLYGAVILGILFSFLSGLYAIYAIGMYVFFDRLILPGWASIITSILFIGGVQLCMLGILGIYIGNIYIETKRRPLYIVSRTNRKL